MIKAEPRFDPRFEDAVDQTIVEFEAFDVCLAAPFRQDSRPTGRQAISAEAKFAHQRYVLGPAVIMIAGNIAGVAIHDLAGQMTKSVPDRRTAAVLSDRSLDLERCGRRSPKETVRKAGCHAAALLLRSAHHAGKRVLIIAKAGLSRAPARISREFGREVAARSRSPAHRRQAACDARCRDAASRRRGRDPTMTSSDPAPTP